MRIVLYNVTTGIKNGGIETYNWEMARALRRAGHEAILVTGCGDRNRFEDVPVTRIPFKSRDQFVNLKWLNRKFASSTRKYLERRSFAANAEVAVKKLRPDCIVIFKPYDFGFMRRLKRSMPELVVVFRSGGKDYFFGDRFSRRYVDVWISCSAYNQQQIEARYGKDVTVIPHGVETGIFKPAARDPQFRNRAGIGERALLGICIGRLVKWKGFQTAIRAIADLPETEILVIGGGGYRKSLEALCSECGTAGRVHFLGELDNYEIAYYLQQSDVYLHPSHGEEAFGITLLEAMASGLPVLASDRGAIPDVVGRTGGVIVPAGDTDAWRSALAGLRENEGRRRALGDAAYARVLENFSWDRSAAALIDTVRGS